MSQELYIDREDDRDTTFGKAADFSRESILNLEKEGYNDTQNATQEYAGLIVSKEGSYKIPIGNISESSI
jgi:DNA-binding XRE family transcriptional regulator